MLLISCPWCGLRDESEFSYGGEAHIVRPIDPDALSDEQWADYLFHRRNPRGIHREQWNHSSGCRRWFYVARDTVSYKIHKVYKVGDTPPDFKDASSKSGDTKAGEIE
jgi:sarcosine oxidase subunit delta